MAKNVYGKDLAPCSMDPLTGYLRDGCCNTGPGDYGLHLVCAEMTAEFLTFSKQAGNDLSTPRPEYNFPGLKPGDRWCVCAPRWKEAYDEGAAPAVHLNATHIGVLEHIRLAELEEHAVDKPGE